MLSLLNTWRLWLSILKDEEKAVMDLIYLSTSEIASTLGISKRRAEYIITKCLYKLGADNRTHAALIYHGVIK